MAGEKDKTIDALWESLTHGKDLQTGKPVFYQLTDDEGGNIFSKFDADTSGLSDRRTLATVDYVYVKPKQGDPRGQLAVSLTIYRPLHRGGIFQKENVPFDETGGPGTCRTIKSSDVGSVASVK